METTKQQHTGKEIDLFVPNLNQSVEFPFVGDIKAGFPSPAEDFVESQIDLNKYLIKHPSATFFARVNGTSMESDFSEGDLLVIDRSLQPDNGRIAVCFVDGEFTVKRILIEKDKCLLVPSNSDYPVIQVNKENDFLIWGIVSYVIKKV